tara:strand:- start:316 stop:483 length:168 start_codon:yes stop_codon:yes gene_type:complete
LYQAKAAKASSSAPTPAAAKKAATYANVQKVDARAERIAARAAAGDDGPKLFGIN